MRDGESGWFYVGNGELRYKDSDGWTDQYQDIDGPAKTSDVEPPASPDVPGSGIGGAGKGSRDPSSLTKLCLSTAHFLIVGFGRLLVGLWPWVVRFGRFLVGLWPWVVRFGRFLVGLWPWVVRFGRFLVGLWPRVVGLSGLLVGLGRLLISGIRRLLVGLRGWTVGLSGLLVGLGRLPITGIRRLLVGLRRWTVGLGSLLVGLGRLPITGIRRLLVGLRRWTVGLGHLIAKGYQQACTRLSTRPVARRHRGPSESRRHRGPSESSVLVERPIGLMKRTGSGQPRREPVRHRFRFLLGSGQSEEEDEPNYIVHLDPERLMDLNADYAGVDRRVPHPGNGIEAEPIVDS